MTTEEKYKDTLEAKELVKQMPQGFKEKLSEYMAVLIAGYEMGRNAKPTTV